MARGTRSAPLRDQHPAGDRLRLHLCQPAPRARRRSALDAGAGATQRGDLADLPRHRTQPGSGVAAVRYRELPRGAAERRAGQPLGVALSGRFPSRRSVSMPGPPATTRCSRSSPGAGDGMPQRTFAKPVEVQITGSILIYDLADRARRQGRTGQGAGGAISRSAPLHPRRLCALRLHALRRALCGVDPVPRLDAARAAAGLPRGLSRRRAFPESLAHRRRPAVAAAPGYFVRHRRAADRNARPISPIARAATSSPTAAPASRAATPT